MIDTEVFKLEDGSPVGTGLVMPNEAEQILMASAPEYPDALKLDRKDIKRLLVINGEQRYLKDREQHGQWMRNQEQLGKCNGSSNTSGEEQLREDQGMPHLALSDCFVYMAANDGQDNGCALIRTLQLLTKPGSICPMELQVGGMTKVMPNNVYNRRQVDRDLLAAADREAKRFCGIEWYKAPIGNFEDFKITLASAIARKHKPIWAWHVGGSSMRLNGNGYMICGRGLGNHSNLLHSGKWVDGDDIVHPDNQNSWGPSKNPLYGKVGGQGWGQGGFGLCTMEDAFSCVRNHCLYIQVAMKADPNDPAFQG